MLSELEQLKKLVLEGGYDEDSKRHVLALETRLQKVSQAETARDIPVVKEWLDYLVSEIARCELLLKTDESLTDLQRSKLFAIIQVSEKYTRLLTGDSRRKLEEEIKRELHVARSQEISARP
jgi:hypothetical protein